MVDPSPVVSVRVPARPDHVHVLRAVASSVAARVDLPFEAVDEFRIAVDEAAALLLAGVDDGDRFELEITPFDAEVRACLSADGHGRDWPPADIERSWAWRVLTGLCDDVRLEGSPRGPAVLFTKRRAAGVE